MTPGLRRRTRATALIAVLAIAGVAVGSLALLGREDAYRSQCVDNLKHLSLGLAMYQGSNKHGIVPFGTVFDAGLPPERRWSWFVGAWATVGDGQLQLLIDPTRPWDAPENSAPKLYSGLDEPPQTFEAGQMRVITCPSNSHQARRGETGLMHFVGIAGLGLDAPSLPQNDPRAGVFGYDRQATSADLKDGASTTLMLAETAQANGPWTAGGPSTVRSLDPDRKPYIGPGHQFGGTHRGGANVAFADGSVRFLRETIDPKVFEALSTAAGGERLPDGWDR